MRSIGSSENVYLVNDYAKMDVEKNDKSNVMDWKSAQKYKVLSFIVKGIFVSYKLSPHQ